MIGNILKHYFVLSKCENEEHQKYLPFVTAHLREALKIVKELDLYTAEEYAELNKTAYPAEGGSSDKELMI